jgi:predicted amidophosphoribosyltransferase
VNILRRLDERGAVALTSQVRVSCGGSFATTLVGSGSVCGVCAGPREHDLDICRRCHDDRTAHGRGLADVVVPLTYTLPARDRGVHHMRIYKTSKRTESRAVLGRMLRTALHLHGRCLERKLGRRLTAWTAVPSRQARPTEPQPLLAIGRGGGLIASPAHLVENDRGNETRVVNGDRFRTTRDLTGQKVLILGDAWVTGSCTQSAALAVRRAGASHVAILVLGRRLDTDQAPVAEFADRFLQGDYDPAVCPAGMCAPAPGTGD